jgi:hypothetical protein
VLSPGASAGGNLRGHRDHRRANFVGRVGAGDDTAGDVPAERGRQLRANLPGAGLPVRRVEAAGRGTDEDFAGGEGGFSDLADGQDVGAAVAVDLDGMDRQEKTLQGAGWTFKRR